MRLRYRPTNLLVDIPAALLLIAAVSKAMYADAFAETLTTWTIIPPRFVGPIALVLPALEIAISLEWLLRLWKRAAFVALFALIGVFTILFTAQIIAAEPPECGCLGLLANYTSFVEDARFVIARNVMLLLALLAAALLHLARRRADVSHTTRICSES